MPHLNPSRTSKLWNPISLSRFTSRHQLNIKIKTNKNIKIVLKKNFVLKNNNKFKIILKINRDINRGQGLNLTI